MVLAWHSAGDVHCYVWLSDVDMLGVSVVSVLLCVAVWCRCAEDVRCLCCYVWQSDVDVLWMSVVSVLLCVAI